MPAITSWRELPEIALSTGGACNVVNKTFDEITLGDTASVERTLQAGDVRAWAAAFGEGRCSPARARARRLRASSRPC